MNGKIKLKGINLLIGGLVGSVMLAACTTGSNVGVLTQETNSITSLADYKSMLKYTPINSNQNQLSLTDNGSHTYHQAFVVPQGTTLTLSAVRVTLFTSNNCQYGTESGVVEMKGNGGVQFPPGTYTSSDASDFALHNRFDPIAEANAQSIRFDYRYESGTDTYGAVDAGWVSAACIPSAGFGDYDQSPPTDCVSGGVCGLMNPQVANLPSTYRAVVYVTAMKTNGNIVATANALPTHPAIYIGNLAADYICNYDANKPSRSAGAKFMAALFLRSVSPQHYGVVYYDSSYQRLVATSNDKSNFLMGKILTYPDGWGYGGSNQMSHSIAEFGEDDPWIGGLSNNRDNLSCLLPGSNFNWSSDSSSQSGVTGNTSLQRIKTDGNGYSPEYWNAAGTAGCDTLHKLVCVQQNDY